MNDPFITQAHTLLSHWSTIRAEMERQKQIDLDGGYSRTAEAQECAILAMDACYKGLEAILPPDRA